MFENKAYYTDTWLERQDYLQDERKKNILLNMFRIWSALEDYSYFRASFQKVEIIVVLDEIFFLNIHFFGCLTFQNFV